MIRRASPGGGLGGGGSCMGRLLIAGAMAAFALFTYFSSKQDNPITGETQYLDMTVDQEIAMGLQAAPEMEAEYAGLDADRALQAQVEQIGNKVVAGSAAGRSPYQFDFHLLADTETINAFALPGGQVFITRALFNDLETEGELAGVLGHEVGHVVARHSAEQIAKTNLTSGLTGAAVIATYDPNNPASMGTAQVAQLIGQLVNLKFGRDDELEADKLGVCFLNATGYDPQEMVGVMQILQSVSQGGGPPEFLSTHPDPGNRITRIQEDIANIDQCPK
ncbi:MAG: M48 family metallopeptidase [Anaerolineales bacterium]